MRRTCFVVSLLAFTLVPLTAQAGDRARLRLTREDGAADCPDARALSDAVGARLGYEPFADDAPRLLVVTFRREGSTLRGVVQMRDAEGAIKGERVLTSARGDCDEVASAATLTISLLLDPRSGLIAPKPPEREPTPDAPPAVSPSPPPDAPPPSPPAEPLHLRVSLGGAGSLGVAPAPALGVLAGLGVEHGWWSATAEFRAELPAEGVSGGFIARTHFTSGALVPCAHIWRAYACAVLTFGAIQGEIAGASPAQESTFHAMLGPRLGLALPLTRWLAIDGHVDGSYAWTSTTLRAGSVDVWTTPTMSGLAGIGMVGRFP